MKVLETYIIQKNLKRKILKVFEESYLMNYVQIFLPYLNLEKELKKRNLQKDLKKDLQSL